MSNVFELSLIIPVFNGAVFLSETLGAAAQWIEHSARHIQLIMVNDGSTDKTQDILADFANAHAYCMVLNLPVNRGKGNALRSGMAYATGEYVAFTDADLPYGLSVFECMIGVIRENSAVYLLYGSRAHQASAVIRGYGLIRKAGRLFFSLAARVFLALDVKDTQCGIKLLRRELAQAAVKLTRVDRFAFDMELFVLARVNFWTYQDFPVELTHRKESSVRVVNDTFGMLRDMIRIRRNLSNGTYVRH